MHREALMSLRSPLLGEDEGGRASSFTRHCSILVALLAVYILFGALERLAFSQMVHSMPTSVLFMHTLLSLMSLSLFIVLQLARSQGGGPPVSEQLQRLHFGDVIQMGFLDSVHSLLALEGGTTITGVTQTLLHQGSVPMLMLLAWLIPLPPFPDQPARQSLRQRLLHMINHLSPSECLCATLQSHTIYRVIGAVCIGVGIVAALDGPPANAPAWMAKASIPMEAERYGRLIFVASTAVGAAAAVHKRRCLHSHPTDLLVLNTCLAGLQLLLGVFIAPPLMLALHGTPARQTLLQLTRGLRCVMSGFQMWTCDGVPDAFGTPVLLTFFILSTCWNATSFALLRSSGEATLAIGSALVLPTALLGFLRPVPLPYSWAAPPEALTQSDVHVGAILAVGLCVCHIATCARLCRTHAVLLPPSQGSSPSDGARTQGARTPTELVGPSLHL